MIPFLFEPDLPARLPRLKTRPLSSRGREGLPERVLRARVCRAPRDLRERELGFLFRYEIFSEESLRFYGEWQSDGRGEMRPGDTIVQRTSVLGLKFVFGVRVLSASRSADRAGFSYGTLDGHPEAGTNEFFFLAEAGELFAIVRTVAEPASLLGRVLAPVFTRRRIEESNRRALENLRRNFLRDNPAFA